MDEVEVEEAKSKRLRIAAVVPDDCVTCSDVCNVQLKNGLEVPIHVNQDEQELEFELMAKEPLIMYETELPVEKVKP